MVESSEWLPDSRETLGRLSYREVIHRFDGGRVESAARPGRSRDTACRRPSLLDLLSEEDAAGLESAGLVGMRFRSTADRDAYVATDPSLNGRDQTRSAP